MTKTQTFLILSVTVGTVMASGAMAHDLHGQTPAEPFAQGMGMHGFETGDMMQMMMRTHMGMQGDAMPWLNADSDGDGSVGPDELRMRMTGLLQDFDENGDGLLSLGEFEVLHAAMIRETTVDRFQAFDADGDGLITSEEISAPADRMDRMMRWQEMMMGTGDALGRQRQTMPGQGAMHGGSAMRPEN